MSYQSELRGLMKERKGWSRGRSAVQEAAMAASLFGQQIVRKDKSWEQAKKGFLQAGGTEEDWKSRRDNQQFKWWEKLLLKPLWGGPEGDVDIGGKRYALEKLKKVGSFQEKFGEDPSAYKEGGYFGTIMEEYQKAHAPGSVIPPPPPLPEVSESNTLLARADEGEFYDEDIIVEDTDFDTAFMDVGKDWEDPVESPKSYMKHWQDMLINR